MTQSVDLAIIGSGPGGYVAAIRAAQLGLDVAIIEERELGGVCLNRGCIPTKAMLHCAEVGRTISSASDYGWQVKDVSLDFTQVAGHAQATANRLSRGVSFLMKKHGVHVISGRAHLGERTESGFNINIDSSSTTTLAAKKLIVATGARAKTLPMLPPAHPAVWSSNEALNPGHVPGRLLVIGSGAIGVEFASLYRALGAEVTLVEMQAQILPAEDTEIAAMAHRAFAQEGIEILTGTTVQTVSLRDDAVDVILGSATDKAASEPGETRQFDRVLVAIGITGNTGDLGLAATSVKIDNGFIHTDAWNATAEPGIYAIGDVAGPPWLAHKASHEAVLCVEHIAGVKGIHPLDRQLVPGCTYSHPQIASLGMTERAAAATGRSLRIGRFPFTANGKALAVGAAEGMAKLVIDKDTGEILGAHLIGPEVTEMINTLAVAVANECTEESLINTVFAHPTLSEVLHEASLDALERALHS